MTPVLHLHGAVGWYASDGTVRDHFADQPFHASLGTPVVLYPDPDKDPTSTAVVAELWTEFPAALAWADHVLVLGHSLHDPALIRALVEVARAKKATDSLFKVAVSYYGDDVDEASVNQITAALPFAIPMYVDFGPELEIDHAAVAGFRG